MNKPIKWVEDPKVQDFLYDRGIKPHFMTADGAAAYYKTKAFTQAINDFSVWQCFKNGHRLFTN